MQRLHHEQVYLDTNIFIAAIEAFNSIALELFRLIERGIVFAMSSEVTRGELLVKQMMSGDNDLIARYSEAMTNGVAMIPVDQEVITEAARLSASTGLELLDAVHCATAHVSDCRYIISEDRDLKTYSEIDVLSLDDLEIAHG